jgi:hypothetical protein
MRSLSRSRASIWRASVTSRPTATWAGRPPKVIGTTLASTTATLPSRRRTRASRMPSASPRASCACCSRTPSSSSVSVKAPIGVPSSSEKLLSPSSRRVASFA